MRGLKMNTVKVGVVGLGNMGSAHARCIYENGIKGLKLTAICDINISVTEHFEKEFCGVSSFLNYKEMIKNANIDAVIIATPHYFHPEIAEFAFENGKHVLTEKPAGVSVSDVKRMNKSAEKSGKVFSIMFNQRTNYLFKQLKSAVENNTLGEIKRVVWNITNWYRTQKYYESGSWRATWAGEGGGILLNQAPHNLDILQWIFGVPDKIFADLTVGKYHKIEVEDDAQIIMKYNNGLNVVFITSTGEIPGTNRLEVSGTKGKAVLEDGKIKFYILKQDERNYCFNSKYLSSHLEYDTYEIADTESESSHKGILQNFANSILFSEPLIANGIEGLNELYISNAAYLSCWQNKWISLENFPEHEFNNILEKLKCNSNLRISENKISNFQTYKKRWEVKW